MHGSISMTKSLVSRPCTLHLETCWLYQKLFKSCLNQWSLSCVINWSHFYAPRKNSGEHIVAALSVRPSVSPSVRPIRVRPITLLFEVGFRNYFTEMTTMLRRRVTRNIWVATLKVKVATWPCSKIVSANNFVIRSRISKIFHRNDHHIEMTCHAQHLGRYLEGQGHSMTFQQNRVWPITLLFEVRFYNYFT